MNLFGHGSLSGFRGVIRQRIKDREARSGQLAETRDAVERVVDGTDARIRLVSGYQKKLRGAVSGALEYAAALVERIPAAITVERTDFASNPYFSAFFVNFADLQKVFRHSSEMRDFLDEHRDWDVSECCALLCMRKTEKTVLGMELAGEVLHRDVAQTAVSFSDHMLYSPATSEAEVREGLGRCLFGGLVTHALERIVALRLENRRVQTDRQVLHARLMHLQRQLQANGHSAASAAGLLQDIERTRREISISERDSLALPRLTPQQALDEVNDVFGHPDRFVRLSRSELSVNNMGIKVEAGSAQASHSLELTEVTVGNDAPRVITLARFACADLFA